MFDTPYEYRYLSNKKLKEIESWAIFVTLRDNDWDRRKSSDNLGISIRCLRDKIRVMKEMGFDIKANFKPKKESSCQKTN